MHVKFKRKPGFFLHGHSPYRHQSQKIRELPLKTHQNITDQCNSVSHVSITGHVHTEALYNILLK